MDLQEGRRARSRRQKVKRGKAPGAVSVCAGLERFPIRLHRIGALSLCFVAFSRCKVVSTLLENALVGSVLVVLAASQQAQAQQASEPQAPTSAWGQGSVDALLRQSSAPVSQPVTTLGSFQLLSSLSASAMYNENISASPGAEREGFYYTLHPELRAASQWRQHRLELFAGGDGRVYQDYASDNQANFYTGAEGEIDIYHDLQVLMQTRYSLHHEERGTADSLFNYRNPIQVESIDSFISVNKQFNRLWFQFGSEVLTNSYSNIALLADRGLDYIDKSFRSGQIYRVVNRSGYEFSGKTSIFIENYYDWRNYEAPTYNSDGYRILGGVRYGLTTFLRGELAAGWMHEGFSAIGRSNLDTYSYRMQVQWEPTPLFNVALVGNRDLATPSEYYGGSSRLNTEAGVRAQYSLRPDVQLNAGAGYELLDYIDRYQHDAYFRCQGSLIYQWWRHMAFSLNYVHEAYVGGDNGSGLNYGRDSIIAGVAAQY
jgi:hypothetical protein